MSLIDTYRFSAHPDIRIEIKIVATPIERKRIEYSKTFAPPRKFAERPPRHFRKTQKNKLLSFTQVASRRVACEGTSAYSEVAQANRAARF